MRTTQDILEAGLRLAKVMEIGESAESDYIKIALDALNDMILGWQNNHEFTWRQYQVTIPLTGEQSYLMGPNGFVKYDGVEKTVTTLAPIGQTFLILNSTSMLNDGDSYSVGANSGNIIQVYDAIRIIIPALTEEVDVGAILISDEKTIPKPLSVYMPDLITGTTKIPIQNISRDEYRLLPSGSTGNVNQVYYERLLTDGRLWVWPYGSTGEIKIMANLQIDFIELKDITKPMPFPDNWFEALKYSLAIKLDGDFGGGIDQSVALIASGSLQSIIDQDTEGVDSIFMFGYDL